MLAVEIDAVLDSGRGAAAAAPKRRKRGQLPGANAGSGMNIVAATTIAVDGGVVLGVLDGAGMQQHLG